MNKLIHGLSEVYKSTEFKSPEKIYRLLRDYKSSDWKKFAPKTLQISEYPILTTTHYMVSVVTWPPLYEHLYHLNKYDRNKMYIYKVIDGQLMEYIYDPYVDKRLTYLYRKNEISSIGFNVGYHSIVNESEKYSSILLLTLDKLVK